MNSVFVTLLAGIAGSVLAQPTSAADAVKNKENVLYSFCSQANCADGANPVASLTDVNGILYGTTSVGGVAGCKGYGCGTVFSVDPNTGVENVLYSFCSQAKCADGWGPEASLTSMNGMLYGTTAAGGTYDYGTAFSINPITGTETVLHSFCSQDNCTDGQQPLSGLVNVKGKLYGTTLYGGANCGDSILCGTVFALDPNTGAETVVYSFCSQSNCFDGANPAAGLINVKGALYGTTDLGGKWEGGTAFSLDEKSGVEKVLYSFCSRENCTDGGNPQADLVDVKGTLYGTTPYGGANCQSSGGCGTVFAVDANTGAETVLYSFGNQQNATDGASPYAGVLDVKGLLYGTTAYGGANCQGSGGCGTVFALDPNTGGETVAYSFCSQESCIDGANPSAALIAVNHNLYSTTGNGGVAGCYGSGCGTVFVLRKRR